MSDTPDPPVVDAEVVLPPEPEQTGVTPEQEATAEGTDALIRAADQQAMGGGIGILTIAGALEQLRHHGVRGVAANLILQVSTARMERELEEIRHERDDERQGAKEWKEKWHEADKGGAVLTTKLGIATEVQIVSNILVTLGGLAVGAGIQDIKLLVFGLVILAIGWLWPFVSRRRK